MVRAAPPGVRDWSGILSERSGKRYSGKPDGDSRNAQKDLPRIHTETFYDVHQSPRIGTNIFLDSTNLMYLHGDFLASTDKHESFMLSTDLADLHGNSQSQCQRQKKYTLLINI